MEMLNQKQKILVIVIGIIAAVIIILYYINTTKSVYSNEDFAVDSEKTEEIKEKLEINNIIVHITGAVKNQGIVRVTENARINDVIEAAGGLENGANLDNVNLAFIVEDGQKIYIPFESDGQEEIDDGEIVTDVAGENVIENDSEKKRNRTCQY